MPDPVFVPHSPHPRVRAMARESRAGAVARCRCQRTVASWSLPSVRAQHAEHLPERVLHVRKFDAHQLGFIEILQIPAVTLRQAILAFLLGRLDHVAHEPPIAGQIDAAPQLAIRVERLPLA